MLDGVLEGVLEGVETGVLLGVGGVLAGLVVTEAVGGVAVAGLAADGGIEGVEADGATDGFLCVPRVGRVDVVGKADIGTVGSAALEGVIALDAVNAVGTCSGSLAENALVVMSIKNINDFIAICLYLRVSLYHFLRTTSK